MVDHEWCAAVMADTTISAGASCLVCLLAHSADDAGLVDESPHSVAEQHNVELEWVEQYWHEAVSSVWLGSIDSPVVFGSATGGAGVSR